MENINEAPVSIQAGLWNVLDAAAYLRKSPRWLWQALRKSPREMGSLPFIRLGRTPRFVPKDLQRWVSLGCPPADTFREWSKTGK